MTVVMLPRRIKHNIIHIMRIYAIRNKCHNNKTKCALKKNKTILKIFKSIENNYDETRIEEGNCVSRCSI